MRPIHFIVTEGSTLVPLCGVREPDTDWTTVSETVLCERCAARLAGLQARVSSVDERSGAAPEARLLPAAARAARPDRARVRRWTPPGGERRRPL